MKMLSFVLYYIVFLCISSTLYASLDVFYEESIRKERGVNIRTPRTVIIPLTSLVLEDMVYMFRNPKTNFIPKKYEDQQEIDECYSQLRAFENMDFADKVSVKIYDYAIFISNSQGRIDFAGLYAISTPDLEGWSEVRSLLKEEYRGQGIGTEAKNAIWEEIIKNLVGSPVKLIKYHNDFNHPEALFVYKDDSSGLVVANLKNAKAYTVSSGVEFRGLQGWVHEKNETSIKMKIKSGWKKVSEKEEIDLEGQLSKFYLYRSS